MEIEVTVNSVRHVPPLTIKYTKGYFIMSHDQTSFNYMFDHKWRH